MTEVWLHSNRRALALGLAPALAFVALGAALIVASERGLITLLGWGLASLGGLLTIGLLRQFNRPRIAYRDGEVHFNLRSGPPVAVPHEIVEAFFLGQGPSYLPGSRGRRTETVNLVARISQKAPEWAQIQVKPALGQWCEGYVTIRGAWCEPLTGDVIRRLNARLRELRSASEASMSAAPSVSHGDKP